MISSLIVNPLKPLQGLRPLLAEQLVGLALLLDMEEALHQCEAVLECSRFFFGNGLGFASQGADGVGGGHGGSSE